MQGASRGGVDRITPEVHIALEYVAKMKSNLDGVFDSVNVGKRTDRRLHGMARVAGCIGCIERCHDFVTDAFDNGVLICRYDL